MSVPSTGFRRTADDAAQLGHPSYVWRVGQERRLPAGCDSAALLPAAERAGVSYVPGDRFFPGEGGERYLRLAFSLLPAEALIEGARRLGGASLVGLVVSREHLLSGTDRV